jgi:hypothetical protein
MNRILYNTGTTEVRRTKTKVEERNETKATLGLSLRTHPSTVKSIYPGMCPDSLVSTSSSGTTSESL